MDRIQGGLMTEIEYKDTHEFKKADLQDLFLSVGWSSGHFPEKLQVAMRNFETVISAWDGEKLVGMICAMDDGVMNAYVHYLLVRPEYQDKGIGKELVSRVKEIYKDYLQRHTPVIFSNNRNQKTIQQYPKRAEFHTQSYIFLN